MSVVNLDQQGFEATTNKEGIVLVDWWAPWCGPCRTFAPIYEQVAADHPDVTFAKVNTEDEPALAGAFRIQAIPTLMAFRDGILVFSQAGVLPAPALEELVKQVQDLDMDKIREELEHRRQAQESASEAPAA